MKILLVSTYELGRQPVHLASPAASLADRGHDVRAVDASVSALTSEDGAWADRMAISVPMHTATRLADQIIADVRKVRPDLPVAVFGLYAGVAGATEVARLEGEYEPGLIAWVESLEDGGRNLGRSEFRIVDRSSLPGLDNYARLEWGGSSALVGAVEASHGCRHRCRHCPIPAVYDGRMRVVPGDLVLSDIDNLVAAGAGHITFGDADFLNAPAHSMAVLSSAHERHPDVTFDVTIKVEHLVDHRDRIPELAAANVLFIVSAFETVDEPTLEILDKGHDVVDMSEAVALTRDAGIYLRPTWLPFFPWTAPDDLADIFDFINCHDLGAATDPVQLAIKLLVPKGSLLEKHPAMTPYISGYDVAGLTSRWSFADPDTELLYKELEAVASDASDCGEETGVTLDAMRMAVIRATGREMAPVDTLSNPAPRLSESWFCCAEPTSTQSVSVSLTSR